jgi:hypothetical protein
MWLADGKLHRDGPADEVVAEYLRSGSEQPLEVRFETESTTPVTLQRVAIRDRHERPATSQHRDQPLQVCMLLTVAEQVPGLDFAISLIDDAGTRVIYDARSDWSEGAGLGGKPGTYEVAATVPPVLTAGRYALEVWIGSEHETLIEKEVMTMRIHPRADDLLEWTERPRVVQPRVAWSVHREPSSEAHGP